MKDRLALIPLLPGVALASLVSLAAFAAERLEAAVTGRAWLEPLVLAILIGTAIRTLWAVPARFDAGVHFAAKTLLELAVVLMGATISFAAVLAAGWPLLIGIAATVVLAIGGGYVCGRLFGLGRKVALLIACGNAICGNSAIAAVAPAIDAESDDVATAIAFTAVLGVAVVLLLPVLAGALRLTPVAGGVLAGLTVYAVPQVIAAATPMGPAAVQIGALVKLIRVLALGPVVTGLSLLKARGDAATPTRRRLSAAQVLPGFIMAFLMLALARSLALVPDAAIPPARAIGDLFTVMAMAGLGLGVDLRRLASAGPRVVATVILSLALLTVIALAVVRLTAPL